MLGRVLAFEFAVAMGVDAFTNYIAGELQDAGYNKEQLAKIAATLSAIMSVFWTGYHCLGGGTARRSEQWCSEIDRVEENASQITLQVDSDAELT
mmetsp:Transcript_27637/g.39044  ORF Transcript_27637/g.39044 Transcript_27637/m.39044 type:complete len:95 (-) Transcript_27637:134-418(-)